MLQNTHRGNLIGSKNIHYLEVYIPFAGIILNYKTKQNKITVVEMLTIAQIT